MFSRKWSAGSSVSKRDDRAQREQHDRREDERDRVLLLVRVQARGDEPPELPEPDRQREHDAAVGRDLQPGGERVERAGEDELLPVSPGHRVVVERDQPADDLRGEDEHERPGDGHRDDGDDQPPAQLRRGARRPSSGRRDCALCGWARGGSGRIGRATGCRRAGLRGRRLGRGDGGSVCGRARRRSRPAPLWAGASGPGRPGGDDDGASNSDTTSRSSLLRCCWTRLNSRKPLPDLAGDLGHLVGAEDEQRDHEDHEDLGRAERGHRGFLSAGLTRRTA